MRGAIFGKPGKLPTAVPEIQKNVSYFGISESDKSGTYSKKYKDGSEDGEPLKEAFPKRMGIGMDENPKVDHKLNPPSFNVPENQDDKTQVPFWIQGVTDDESDRMYFRTVISGLSETVTPTWSGNKFIGNPHNYYIYEGVERAITFNLNIYCMNQNELSLNWQRIDFLTRQTYPSYGGENLDIINAPFIKFQLGDVYKDRTGFIESLTYTVPDNGNWEIDVDGLKLPKFIDVSMTIKLVETPGIETELYNYGGSPKT